MTGFGSADGVVGSTQVSVELRTVNHRFFNPSIKLPSAFARWEGDVREALRQRIARGHVTVSARLARDAATPTVTIDEVRFAGYVTELRALQAKHGLGGDLDLATVLRMPNILGDTAAEPDTGTAAEFVAIVVGAAEALSGMRDEEGRRLAGFLLDRLAVIQAAIGRIATRAPTRLVEQRDRLRAAVRELADGVGIDEQRLSQEVALLADRLDVSEEVERFGAHVDAFRDAVESADPEPVGKRLGFLVQEMLREANTTGSKANDTAIVRDVVLMKEELERIREQVENVE